jgi:hypothetical protein
MAELGDHPPFFGIGVLKLVDDDQGIGAPVGGCQGGHCLEKLGEQRRKEIEGDQSIAVEELALACGPRIALETGEMSSGLCGQKQGNALLGAEQIPVAFKNRPGEAVIVLISMRESCLRGMVAVACSTTRATVARAKLRNSAFPSGPSRSASRSAQALASAIVVFPDPAPPRTRMLPPVCSRVSLCSHRTSDMGLVARFN